jgi:Tfp pilus assembly protein PilN
VRDLEFLPDWYPQTRRRRRMIVLQAWLTIVLVAGMASWVVLKDRNNTQDERTLALQTGQLDQTYAQLAEVDKLDSMRQQLRQQEAVVSRIGFPVEACKAVNAIDERMPRQMALTGVVLEHEEKVDPSALAANRGSASASSDVPVERRLRVRVQGVCPTDVDLADFMTQLATVPFFEGINNTYARERVEQNRAMREFEVTFSVNLSLGS